MKVGLLLAERTCVQQLGRGNHRSQRKRRREKLHKMEGRVLTVQEKLHKMVGRVLTVQEKLHKMEGRVLTVQTHRIVLLCL
jgi:hypothetical protein